MFWIGLIVGVGGTLVIIGVMLLWSYISFVMGVRE